MKHNSFVRICVATLLCVLQVNAMYANNDGPKNTLPAQQKSAWSTSTVTLFAKFHIMLEQTQSRQQQKGPKTMTNSTITNQRPGGKELDMAWLEIEYLLGQPTDYISVFDPNNIVLQTGQSASFTIPDVTQVRRVSLRHLGSSFPCEEYGIFVTNNGNTTEEGWSSCVERIEWFANNALFITITNGMTITVY